MRPLIAFINMTLDGFCDHTAMIADAEVHEAANDLLRETDTIVFGRKTYQLMEDAWPEVVKHPTGNIPMDTFARLIDDIDKVVFSSTLQEVTWKNTTLVKQDPENFIRALKEREGKPIALGSPSFIAALLPTGLIDELRLCIQPIILGEGLRLFKNIPHRIDLKLLNTKPFASGIVMQIYRKG
ncbi:dihydrofolate reductase family protein [Flavihumibacter petaseus]|uniref:Bacterial bifunctional deaminase-reductase C-terminal domain-containing protein n=1 Tax=Flavihumibacter petaseus NBRC 106054 TaxID=1220578 RepID=A0A0E9N4D0_9BACT|nr:dihydrofolate reductase family protein [Flavihumibacter petaseus]GAO44220.1 hypothetical protein FPE01S_03_02580 [Flavihumibacter petaseus NBRC 106054]